MSSVEPQEAECRWCGAKAAENAEVCPLCRKPMRLQAQEAAQHTAESRDPESELQVTPAYTRATRVEEPLPPAPGEGEFGSWASIKEIFRTDKLFSVVLILIAMQTVVAVISGAWMSAVFSGILLWGIVTFRWWGLWIAAIGAGFGVMNGVMLMLSGSLDLPGLVGLAINGFVLWVLYSRKDLFD